MSIKYKWWWKQFPFFSVLLNYFTFNDFIKGKIRIFVINHYWYVTKLCLYNLQGTFISHSALILNLLYKQLKTTHIIQIYQHIECKIQREIFFIYINIFSIYWMMSQVIDISPLASNYNYNKLHHFIFINLKFWLRSQFSYNFLPRTICP